MVMRSRRLETLFGAGLDRLTAEHVRRLVPQQVEEAQDLDFKREHYGDGDSEKRSLATDVAAMANTVGGIILIGVDETEGRASGADGVQLSETATLRIRHIVAAKVAPVPSFEVITVPDEAATDRGFLLIAVPESAMAPHAVVFENAVRYP